MEQTLLKKGTKCEYAVSGMHCAACELVIEKKFEKLPQVKKVNAVLNEKKVYFEIERDISQEELLVLLNKEITADGYSVSEEEEKHTINYTELAKGFLFALLVLVGFLLLQKLGIANILGGRSLSLPGVFTIGIVASLSSCMAVVGGLVLSISSSYVKSEERALPLVLFHVARLVSFLVLGGVVGFLGSLFTMSITIYFIMSVILFAVMIILGMNLLDVFPIFRKLQLKMPKSFAKSVVNTSNVQNAFMPALLGAATFFLPCGFTQTMQVNAMATGNWLQGALLMATFALGTLPVLGLISFTSVKLSHSLQSGVFFKTAGFVVLFFALYNFTSALVAAGYIAPLF